MSTPSRENREQWIVTNISTRHLSLGTILAPALKPGDSYDLLLYLSMEQIGQSKAIKVALDRGWITLTKRRDEVDIDTVDDTNSDTALVQAEEGEAITLSDELDMAGSIIMNGNTLALGDGTTDNSGGIIDLQGGTLDGGDGDITSIDGYEVSASSGAPANNSRLRFHFTGDNLTISVKRANGTTASVTLTLA